MKSALHEYGINHSNEKTPIVLTIGVHFFIDCMIKFVTKLLHFCNIFGAHTFI